MIIKKYKNGNITAKMEADDRNRESVLVNLIWALGDNDCQLFGEEYCLSNLEMAVDVYDSYNDMLIRIPYRVLDDLDNGKTVRLYARPLDEYDREELARLQEAGEL